MSKFWCLFLLLSPPLPPYRYSKCISLGKVCVCEPLLFLTRTPVRAYSFVHSTRKFSQIIPVCRKVCVLFVMRCIWRRAWSIRRWFFPSFMHTHIYRVAMHVYIKYLHVCVQASVCMYSFRCAFFRSFVFFSYGFGFSLLLFLLSFCFLLLFFCSWAMSVPLF